MVTENIKGEIVRCYVFIDASIYGRLMDYHAAHRQYLSYIQPFTVRVLHISIYYSVFGFLIYILYTYIL